MKKSVNYDKIAEEYDQRFLNNPHHGVLNTLRRILSQENPQKVLEVGCGTGHWLKGLKSIKNTRLFGLDSSFGMLKSTGRAHGINRFQGVAENLPIHSKSIDFIFCVNAFHHFDDKLSFIQESYRILSKGGCFAIIGMDPRDDRNRWYIYKYFKGTYERDLERFPSWAKSKDWLKSNGFKEISLQDVEIIHDPKMGKAVLNDPFLKKSACSQLALLSDAAYEKGLSALRSSLIKNSLEKNLYEDDIVLSMMLGRKA